MTRAEHRDLLRRARNWVKANQCPFPVDLTTELLTAGIDAGRIEEQLLNDKEMA